MALSINWTAFSKVTGQIVADLDGVTLAGDLFTQIGQPEITPIKLALEPDSNPYDWLFGTGPNAVGIVGWVGPSNSRTILGGGWVQQRQRTLDAVVPLSLVSPEAALAEAQVGAYIASVTNQDDILNYLVSNFAVGANRPQWILTPTNRSTGTQSVNFTGYDRISVLQAIQGLAASASTTTGQTLEWMTSWKWDTAANTIKPVLTYGARFGRVANPNPNVTIELGDCQNLSFLEDCSDGKVSNDVIAYGPSATGGTSGVALTTRSTSPTFGGHAEVTWTFAPPQQFADTTSLQAASDAALAAMNGGTNSLQLSIENDVAGKQYGIDWNIGDDIGFYLYSKTKELPQFAIPVKGTARCIGARINHDLVTPILTKVVVS